MLFISIRSATVENVPKVLLVVEEIKRLRHKAGMWFVSLRCLVFRFRTGLDEEGELHQYVIYEQAKQKGPKVIKLDDPKGKNPEVENYTPPTSLTVHLSKIDMPELKPRAHNRPLDKNIVKEWEKERTKPTKKGKRKEDEGKPKPNSLPPPLGKSNKPSSSSSKPPPSPGYSIPPPTQDHGWQIPSLWAGLYPSQFSQPPYQQGTGALNTTAPSSQPPQVGSVVSSLVGRLDRFARR